MITLKFPFLSNSSQYFSSSYPRQETILGFILPKIKKSKWKWTNKQTKKQPTNQNHDDKVLDHEIKVSALSSTSQTWFHIWIYGCLRNSVKMYLFRNIALLIHVGKTEMWPVMFYHYMSQKNNRVGTAISSVKLSNLTAYIVKYLFPAVTWRPVYFVSLGS